MGYFWGNLGVNLKIEIEKKESGCRVPDVRYKRRRWPKKRPVKSNKKLMNVEHRTLNVQHRIRYFICLINKLSRPTTKTEVATKVRSVSILGNFAMCSS